ncbi:TPA: toll/interleukin-1 receptor domain-containing protein [Synechococcus sp. WH 5701]
MGLGEMPESLERFWEDLLLFVEEGKVIPVIGPELVAVEEGGNSIPLYHWLARSLAERIDLPFSDLPDPFDLNDVVAQSIRRGDERDELNPRLLQILRKAPTTLSPALRALASIPTFKVFVSLTFDSQLELALAQACHGAKPRTIACATNTVHDLPEPYEDLDEQVIVQLLGRASSTPDYAICDEDLLEFLHALQDGQRRPVKLFDALRANHLLFLGCGFGDWLARFFLRTARGMALSQKRKRWVVMADERATSEPSLAEFLSCFSADSHVLEMSAGAFVEELSQRWHAAHPVEAGAEVGAMQATAGETGPREGAVFVSYASEDRNAAQRLAEGLRAARLDVWFDQHELRPADDWALSIERGIERCSLFLPVISHASLAEENRRRYFWREWNAASNRAGGMAPDEEFIVPVVVDDTRLDQSLLPESFRRKQGPSLPGGELTPEVAQRLTEIVRNFHRRLRDTSR